MPEPKIPISTTFQEQQRQMQIVNDGFTVSKIKEQPQNKKEPALNMKALAHMETNKIGPMEYALYALENRQKRSQSLQKKFRAILTFNQEFQELLTDRAHLGRPLLGFLLACELETLLLDQDTVTEEDPVELVKQVPKLREEYIRKLVDVLPELSEFFLEGASNEA